MSDLVAAVTGRDVDRPCRIADDVGHGLENEVALEVSLPVVDPLEVVDIEMISEISYTKRNARETSRSTLAHVAPVPQARKGVRNRLFGDAIVQARERARQRPREHHPGTRS
jgi:hypothetical protein